MGQEIDQIRFDEAAFSRFEELLRQETEQLAQWFRQGRLENRGGCCGYELEAWLIDANGAPAPVNETFLSALNDPEVVPELSTFNFELNSTPQIKNATMFSQLEAELEERWRRCRQSAKTLDSRVLLIGTLPSLTDNALTLDRISSQQRYYALNREILERRKGEPLQIDICGEHDRLRLSHNDVMTEAATTSLQIHLQVPASRATAFYNAALIASAPMVAASANSPFLFGARLWEETRIPLFEQAVSAPAFYDKPGHVVDRVTFGTRYANDSLMEVFTENLDGFPVLLPVVDLPNKHELAHLRLHNGTIWRWNRPLIGFSADGTPHLRIEHRVAAAGPSIIDTIANICLFYGLVHALTQSEIAPESRLPFEHARANFYQAAELGLEARVFWLDGHEHSLRSLLLEQLIPQATEALAALGISTDEIDRYLKRTVAERVDSRQTGACWQRRFTEAHGTDFHQLVQTYYQHQQSGLPVHQWPL